MAANLTFRLSRVRIPKLPNHVQFKITRNLSLSNILRKDKEIDTIKDGKTTTPENQSKELETIKDERGITTPLEKPLPRDEYGKVIPPAKLEPMARVARIFKHDMKAFYTPNHPPLEPQTKHVDIAIIGGGVMGSAIAYFLKERIPRKGLNIMVIEKDPGYTRSSTVLSMGGVRQQFSLPENVRMSMFGAEFLRNAHKHLAVEDSAGPDMHFHPQGYLFLASEEGAEQMIENREMQIDLGAKVELLTPTKLKEKFPWINTDGVALATHGLENEGWFDPWSLLYGFKRKAIAQETEYVHGEVVGFEFLDRPEAVTPYDGEYIHRALDKIIVKYPDGDLRTVKFSIAILAAGHESGKIARMADIGNGELVNSIPLPVEARKRFVYFYHAPDSHGPGLDCPLVIDTSGAYFRREGLANYFLGGQSPPLDEEPNTETLDVDYGYFDSTVWPNLANRVPAFNNIKVKSAWAGYYDYNTFDQNAIIGPHPYYNNLYFACGFSGHGIQQAAAIGRATAEMILDGEFRRIDLSRFLFDRLIVGKEIKEQHIV